MRRFPRRGGYSEGRGMAPRRGMSGGAQAVNVITSVIVGVIVLGIILVLLEANRGNDLVDLILDVGGFFVEPFDNIFKLDTLKGRVLVNWGIGALIYGAVGGLLARALAR